MKRGAQSTETLKNKAQGTQVNFTNRSCAINSALENINCFEQHPIFELGDVSSIQKTPSFINQFSTQENKYKRHAKKARYCYLDYSKIEKIYSYNPDDNPDQRLYKLKKINNIWRIVPREFTINNLVKNYSDSLLKLKGFSLHHYIGVPSEFNDDASSNDVDKWLTSYEEQALEKVMDLPLFGEHSEGLCAKGKAHNIEGTQRQYTIQKPLQLPVACLDIDADALRNKLHVQLLSISPEYQKSGLGSILLHLAVEISALYGYTKVSLESAPKAVRYYLGHGFEFKDAANNIDIEEHIASLNGSGDDMKLNLLNDHSINTLDKCHIKAFQSEAQSFASTLSEHINWLCEKSNDLQGIVSVLKNLGALNKPNGYILKNVNEKLGILAKEVCIPKEFFEEFKIAEPQPQYFKKTKNKA